MAIFLVLQAQSSLFEVGLFLNSQSISTHREDKKYSSRTLIPAIDSLLKQNNLSLNDVAALGVNQGPGPFTSLRIALTTANGLSFATGIPLIGHNSLEALLMESSNEQWPATIALLNAFNNDLYYGFFTSTGLEIGCNKSEIVFTMLKERFENVPLRFLGNGTTLYKNKILAIFKNVYIPDPLLEECSLQQLACMTYASYEAKKGLEKILLPHYLKDIAYATHL